VLLVGFGVGFYSGLPPAIAGWRFWLPGEPDSPETSVWRSAIAKHNRYSLPSGFVDYPVRATIMCNPLRCGAGQRFSDTTLRSMRFFRNPCEHFTLADMLSRWADNRGLARGSTCSLTRAVWGPIAEVIVRGEWPVPFQKSLSDLAFPELPHCTRIKWAPPTRPSPITSLPLAFFDAVSSKLPPSRLPPRCCLVRD
jgi:hypothetical protein